MRTFAIASVLAAIALSVSASWAQVAPPNGRAPGNDSHMGQNNYSQEQFNQIQEYADQARRLTKADKAKGKTLNDVLAEDKAAVINLVKIMPLSCEVLNAMQVAEGPETINGKTVNTKTYEAACGNGMGYFLVSQDNGQSYGFSCFAADATHADDVAAGRQPGPVCQLPDNADLKLMGTHVLAKAGVNCAVNNYKWLGRNAANHIEFDEFACGGGQGYIVITAQPGSTAPVNVRTCGESAARGLPCTLALSTGPKLN